ncbi:hypothetical protein HY967_03110 [Candidatus Jorgensenbacteria bacterium]|nr:hypothetical protein [Candidatus Jorgensenbacteria bacterium]
MNQNPIVISQTKEIESDRSPLKIILIGVVGVVLSTFSIYYVNQFLFSAKAGHFWLSVLFSVVFVAVTILQTLFIKGGGKLKLIALVESIAPLSLFYERLYPDVSIPLLFGAGLFFIFVVGGLTRGSKILENGLKIRFWEIASSVTSKAVTGLLIFISVLIYLNYFKWGNLNEEVGRKLLHNTMQSSAPAVKYWIPVFSAEETIGNVLRSFSEEELKRSQPDIVESTQTDFQTAFNQLPEEAKTKLIEEVTVRLRSSLESIVGPLKGDDQVVDVAYRFIKNYAVHMPEGVRSYIGFAVAVLAFFAIKGIAVLFYWFINAVAFMLFKFLLVLNFAYVSLETRSREFIMLS